jgi:hypothetical protein
VSTVTARVVIVAEPLTLGLAEDVAVTVDVLEVPSVAEVGGVTLTQTLNVPPAVRSGVAEIAVVQVES